jgi:hypothetical protein
MQSLRLDPGQELPFDRGILMGQPDGRISLTTVYGATVANRPADSLVLDLTETGSFTLVGLPGYEQPYNLGNLS